MLDETKKLIRKFRDDRDFAKFHNGKDLAISISLEASELLENYQWSQDDLEREDHLENIKEELADILIYCEMFCDHYHLDQDEIIKDKLIKNLKKYPEGEKIDLRNRRK